MVSSFPRTPHAVPFSGTLFSMARETTSAVDPQDLPDDLFSTTWTEREAWIIQQLMLGVPHHAAYENFLHVIRLAVRHIDALQDKIARCDSCNCACDFEHPGAVCSVHYDYPRR